jgi:hypothetical protein
MYFAIFDFSSVRRGQRLAPSHFFPTIRPYKFISAFYDDPSIPIHRYARCRSWIDRTLTLHAIGAIIWRIVAEVGVNP